jgi:hypothetical protein
LSDSALENIFLNFVHFFHKWSYAKQHAVARCCCPLSEVVIHAHHLEGTVRKPGSHLSCP